MNYRTKGTCTINISFELDGDKIKWVRFDGGCPGNLAGLMSILEGMDAQTVIEKFDGIKCGRRNSSCPDQLAKALTLALEKQE